MTKTRRDAKNFTAITTLIVALIGSVLVAPAGAERGSTAQASAGDDLEVQFVRHLTGASPFTDGCGDESPEDAIVDSEVEAHIAVNPTDPDHLLASWQQDRNAFGGGARSDLVAVSKDGGETWTGPLGVPGISSCTDPGNPFTRATDPWGAIGPDGTAYLASLAFTNEAGVDPNAAEQVSVSPDGGITWDPQPAAIEANTTFLEKPEIAADPVKPGHAYLVYFVLENDLGVTTDGFMRFARTVDGGQTWTAPATIPPDLPGFVETPMEILAIPEADGSTTLVTITEQFPALTQDTGIGPFTYASIRSTDGGTTWSAPSEIVTFAENRVRGDAETPAKILPGTASAAVGRDGTLYVAWAEYTPVGTSPGGTDVRVARSDDAGDTWTTSTVASFPHIASLATVAVAGDGTVGVMWYDARNDTLGDEPFTMDVWFASSQDRGASWQELHLAGPFDMRRAPARDDGAFFFLGDYAGLVGFPHGFGALFPLAPGDVPPMSEVVGPSDVFFARLGFPQDDPPGGGSGKSLKVTGGGTVPGESGSGEANFSVGVQGDGRGGLKGNLKFRDRDAGVTIEALSYDGLLVSETESGRACNIFGTAELSHDDGSTSVESFTVRCEDNGEPGRDDVFAITTDSYSGGGQLTGGNIQIHGG